MTSRDMSGDRKRCHRTLEIRSQALVEFQPSGLRLKVFEATLILKVLRRTFLLILAEENCECFGV